MSMSTEFQDGVPKWRTPNKGVLLRRWIAVCAALLVLLLACTVLAPRRSVSKIRPRITEEQVASIHVGMSLQEVEHLLGCQPGNYTCRTDFLPLNMDFASEEQRERKEIFQEWAADTCDPLYTDANGPNRQEALAIRVWFDEQGKVIDKHRMGIAYTLRPPTLWDRLNAWILNWELQ
jgi:hypothetical protein